MMRPWLTVLFAAQAIAFAAPDFQREVRPILARHCFKCHGPDKKTRKAKLRLEESGPREAPTRAPFQGSQGTIPVTKEAQEGRR